TSTTQTSFTLTWSASTDNVGVAGYALFLDGIRVGTTTSTSYGYTGLACGTAYTVTLEAFDAAGNYSDGRYAQWTASTAACTVDATPPSVPDNMQQTATTQTSFTFAWSASTDDVGVAGYALFRDGTRVGTTTSTS